MTRTTSIFVLALISLAGCRGETCAEPRWQPPTSVAAGPLTLPAAERTISVQGTAEVLTAPDTFELVVGFELQEATVEAARDASRARAAALLAVVERHGIPAADVQTQELSLQPRHEGYERHRIVGYEASRGLALTLRSLEAVEPVLYDMLKAGANRVQQVRLVSSAAREKRAEARVQAVEAARAKAEAMAAALGQALGEPLRIEEQHAEAGFRGVQANMALTNDTVPEIGETMAGGRVRVQASVAVTFALRPA